MYAVGGRMLEHGMGYGPVFAISSTFHVIAFGIILLAVRRVQPLTICLNKTAAIA
jgi:hypothetical protein